MNTPCEVAGYFGALKKRELHRPRFPTLHVPEPRRLTGPSVLVQPQITPKDSPLAKASPVWEPTNLRRPRMLSGLECGRRLLLLLPWPPKHPLRSTLLERIVVSPTPGLARKFG